MAKQNPNVTYQWCSLEIFARDYYVSQWFFANVFPTVPCSIAVL